MSGRRANYQPVPRFRGQRPWRFHASGFDERDERRALLGAAHVLPGAPVDVLAIDMPIATVPITGRRVADDAVSKMFGVRGCSTHTPSATRPGPVGAMLTAALLEAGFQVATAGAVRMTRRNIVEVYPHPALLTLLGRAYRVPYKVGKARKYWPSLSPRERIERLLLEWQAIIGGLQAALGPIPLALPESRTASVLKRFEDALDAVLCAWIRVRFVEGAAFALGDGTGAVWCPRTTAGDRSAVMR